MYLRYGNESWETADGAELPSGNGRSHDRAPTPRRDDGPAGGFPIVKLRGVALHAITEARCIAHVLDELDAGRGGVLVTPNLDHLRRCVRDVNFGALVAEADLVVADGMPLVWASRIQGTPLPERVAGSNLISSLSGAAAERGRSIFLLGGAEGTASAAADILKTRFPALKIAGSHYPQIGFEDDPKLLAEIVQALANASPDIVYVALGSPKQERLIARLRQILPAAWWLGVGISFSFLCGEVRRAPRWMQRSGLEWVHRLFQEPRRLFKRYIVTGLPFATGLLTSAALNGIANRFRSAPDKNDAARTAIPAAADDHAGANGHAVLSPPAPESRISVDTAPFEENDAPHGESRLSRLRALVLLGGSVRPSPLGAALNRSVLDLPLDEKGSVLNHWLNQALEVAQTGGLEKLPVRVMVNQNSPEPNSADPRHYGTFRVERDLSEYRGTGGVLQDVASDYGDDDLILVANAAQILLDPLALIVTALERKGGDVGLIAHADGTPSGIMLLTCKTLRLISDNGFVDMKEQALPMISTRFDVRVMHRRKPTGLPIRTLEDYIQALRYHHRRRIGRPYGIDPLAEDWSPAFALIEAGATVDSSARIHDSVVLAGAVVEPGAVLVRSVVGAGLVIRRDRTAVDQLLTANHEGKGSDRKSRRAARRDKIASV